MASAEPMEVDKPDDTRQVCKLTLNQNKVICYRNFGVNAVIKYPQCLSPVGDLHFFKSALLRPRFAFILEKRFILVILCAYA